MSSGAQALVGRRTQLTRIAASLRRTQGARGAVLVGAAGVGKTRLAREAAAFYAQAGHRVRWVSGSASARSIPLGAFADFVPDADGNPVQLLRRAVRQLLDHGTTAATTLICVDDAHELDDLSAVLLQQLAVQVEAPVLVTVRSGEPAPEAVAALWARDVLPRLDVPPLSTQESLDVVAALVGGTVADDSVTPLAALARGNPLFLRQIVDGERAAGRLTKQHGSWRWLGGFAPSVELGDLIDVRQHSLPMATLAVLDVVSLAGPLEHRVMTQLCSSDQIEAAEQAGVVEVTERGRSVEIAPAHPLFAEVRRVRIGHLARRRILGRAAEALATVDQTSHVVLRRANLSRSANLPVDPDLMTRAAECAGQLLNWDLATDFAEEALLAGAGPKALAILAFGLSFTLRNEAAEEVFDRLCAPGTPLSPDERSLVVMSRAAHNFWFLRRVDAAMALLHSEIDTVDDPVTTDALESVLAMFEVSTGRIQAGLDRTRAVDRRGTPRAMGGLCGAWATVAALGALGQITDYRQQAINAYERAGDEYNLDQPRIATMQYYVLALVTAGHVSEAKRTAARVGDDVDDGLSYPFLNVEVLKALVCVAGGELCAGRDHATHAVDGLDGRDDSGWMVHALIPLTVATAQLGEIGAASEALRRCEAERHPAHALIEPEIQLARAWVTACSGAVSKAIAYAVDAADWARDHGQPGSELGALEVAVRLGARTLAPRVAALSPHLGGPRPPAVLAYATALDADDGDALLRASEALEAIGDRLASADAAAQACSAFSHAGRRGSQHVAADRAYRLARDCDDARTPALLAAVYPLPLTDREREIITLAGHGLTNRDIAAELTLSVRTVEGHLYRAAAKLGVHDRRDFAGLVG